MGDRTAVVIEIGGRLPAADLDAFLEACEADSVQIDWTEEVTDKSLRAALAEGAGPLVLTASEVNYAELSALEGFLIERAMPYRKSWDAGGGYGAGGEYFDGESTAEYTTNGTDGMPFLAAPDIRHMGSWEAVLARLERLERPLPAFEIID